MTPNVPDEVMSGLSVMNRVIDKSRVPPIAAHNPGRLAIDARRSFMAGFLPSPAWSMSGGAWVLLDGRLGSGPLVAALDDLERDDRGEQERALEDHADLLRDAEAAERLGGTTDRRPHERGGGDADRVVAAEQGAGRGR